MDNPLKIPILELLNELELPLTEYQLIQQIKLKLSTFPTLSESHSVALFQLNFLVMNALYQLQEELLQEHLYLSISPLKIDLQPLSSTCSETRALSQNLDSRLSEYFFDWSHFEDTGESEVEALLQQFWKYFLNNDLTQRAYQTLAVSPDANWTEIKNAYRKQALRHHPDKGGQSTRFIEIRQAYEVLKNRHHSLHH